MGGIKDLIKTYSFRSFLKSNILSVPGTYNAGGTNRLALAGGTNQASSNHMLGSRYMTAYYLRMQEILDYEITELTNTIVGIFKDYLITYFNDTDNLITIKDQSKKDVELKINQIFKQLKYVDDCKKHLTDIIYHGGYSYQLNWDRENKRYNKISLSNPHTVIDVYKGDTIQSRLVTSVTGKIKEVEPLSIVRLGSTDLSLINDMTPDYEENFRDADKITTEFEFMAGTPLYYNIAGKIKELILKDQVISLLGIKDLIQPLLLLISVEKNTPTDMANQLALNTENLINKYSDISSIMTTNFSIADLMDSLINNIRVLPDYANGMGNMNTVDLSKISEKIEQIRNEQDNLRENVLNSVGIPLDLFAGRSTRFEALKTSERLNSKINYFCKSIDTGVCRTASDLYYILTEQRLDPSEFESNMFTKTTVEYNASINSADLVATLIQAVNSILEQASAIVKSSEIVNPEAYFNYISDQLKMIDPDLAKIVSDDDIKKAVNLINLERQAAAQGGGVQEGY
jgi:hypothetical protein